jgi:hypothetical protein
MFAFPRPESYLLPTERRVLRTRRHWAKLVPDIAMTIVVVAVLVGVNALLSGEGGAVGFVHSVLWYGQMLMLARLAVIVLDWWDDLIMITDERIMNVTGLLASKMKDTPIGKITDRDIRHTVLGTCWATARSSWNPPAQHRSRS